MIPEKRSERQAVVNKEQDKHVDAAKQQKLIIYRIYENQDKTKTLESISRYVVGPGYVQLELKDS